MKSLNSGQSVGLSLEHRSFKEPGNNNIGLIRTFAAVLVLYSHTPLACLGDVLAHALHPIVVFVGCACVDVFFFMGGVLLCKSFADNPDLVVFFRRRVQRIFPGFFWAVVSGFTIVILYSPERMLILQSLVQKSTVLHDGWRLLTLSRDMLVKGPNALPVDPMVGNPFPTEIIGTAWTLRPEFKYVYLLVGGMMGLIVYFKPRLKDAFDFEAEFRYMVLAMLIMVMVTLRFNHDMWNIPARMSTYSLAGITAYLFREKIPLNWPLVFISVLLLAFAGGIWGIKGFSLAEPFGLMYIVLYVSFFKPLTRVSGWYKVDICFGIYLYGFQIQQVIAVYWHTSMVGLFLVALPLSILMGLVSWYLVESPISPGGRAFSRLLDPIAWVFVIAIKAMQDGIEFLISEFKSRFKAWEREVSVIMRSSWGGAAALLKSIIRSL